MVAPRPQSSSKTPSVAAELLVSSALRPVAKTSELEASEQGKRSGKWMRNHVFEVIPTFKPLFWSFSELFCPIFKS